MKLLIPKSIKLKTTSPLVRGRGLKPLFFLLNNLFDGVAPRAGAWIETHKKDGSL